MKLEYFKSLPTQIDNIDNPKYEGVSSFLCGMIDEKIIISGGSNFPNELPPTGKRKVYDDVYLLDKNFNVISQKKTDIFFDRGLCVNIGDALLSIASNKIYKYSIIDNEIVIEKICDLDFELICGFAYLYNNKVYFGNECVYELDLNSYNITKKSKFIAPSREQCVFSGYKDYIYIFGGASNICHMDSYKYSISEDKWYKLDDIPTSLTGAAFHKIDDENLLIMGGFNKEVYDNAVKNLSDINFKINYFKTKREDFKWNKKVLKYNFKNEKFSIAFEDENSATCGSSILKIDNNIFLIMGEIKPGYRSPKIFTGEIS